MFLRLFRHCVIAAASRTFWTAGTRSAIKMAMIAMTTSNSISVNADRLRGEIVFTSVSPKKSNGKIDESNRGLVPRRKRGLLEFRVAQAIDIAYPHHLADAVSAPGL